MLRGRFSPVRTMCFKRTNIYEQAGLWAEPSPQCCSVTRMLDERFAVDVEIGNVDAHEFEHGGEYIYGSFSNCGFDFLIAHDRDGHQDAAG